ncbi:MAG: Hsp20/alpha crystallin family protein [Pseudomonadota bacterium]
MSLIHYEPWSLLNRFRRDLDALAATSDADSDRDSVYNWVPAVDVAERDDSFVLSADVPGVDPATIDVSMVDGALVIRGERVRDSELGSNGVRRIERRTGKFYRRFQLPDTVDADNISARSSFGVLEVTIPKQAKPEPRRITINAA